MYEGQPLYHPKGWWTRYVFSQDHKIIALQYTCVALAIGLTGMFLSLMMRMQLGFPGLFESIDAGNYYQDVTMHGMIMVIYLLTALFLGGFGNYLIPLMLGSRDMAFPFVNMLSFWVYFLSVIILVCSFFVESGPTGAGWTLYPPQSILPGTPGADGAGILFNVGFISSVYYCFYYGRIKLHHHRSPISGQGHEHDEDAFDYLVSLFSHFPWFTGLSRVACGSDYVNF